MLRNIIISCFLINITLFILYLTVKCKHIVNHVNGKANGILASFFEETVELQFMVPLTNLALVMNKKTIQVKKDLILNFIFF